MTRLQVKLFLQMKWTSHLCISMTMPLLKITSDKYYQIWTVLVMIFLKEFPFIKHSPYLRKIEKQFSVSISSHLRGIWEKVHTKLLLSCKNILKNFQLTSRVECKPSLFFGPRSFFMFSFMFSFLCCLKAFSWSHRAILNRRSGDELYIKQR